MKTDKEKDIKVNDKVDIVCKTMANLTQKDKVAISYILKKVSKITTVTLMLSDVLEENNFIRSELQRTSIELIKIVSEGALSVRNRRKVVTSLLELLTLLETSKEVGYLSKMNVEVLSGEIINLNNFIDDIDWTNGRRFMEEDMFGGMAPKELFTNEPIVSKTNVFNRQETDTAYRNTSAIIRQSVAEEELKEKDTNAKRQAGYKERVQEIQKDRRATILGLVQKKDRITVKDVANIIKDCSNKTIQRELLALVKQGVLKKEGERRWSTYSLA